MMPPTWLDAAIQAAIDTNDPNAIAQAIATSPPFLDAIKRGLTKKLGPRDTGPTPAQLVRQELTNALGA